MQDGKQTVLITGVSGNLGLRLLAQLSQCDVVGVDLAPPKNANLARFQSLDLGDESACWELMGLIRETQPNAVVHLAFVIDPVRTGVLDVDRMWHINVAGTARVMEAIAEVNRMGGQVEKFIFPSSVSAYGSHLPTMVKEDYPLGGHTLPYAIHKRDSDRVVQMRAAEMFGARTYLLRPHIYAGASVQNYLIGAFRGTPTGHGRRASRMRDKGKRLPIMLPLGEKYLQNRIQFVHVDDMARLITHILRRQQQDPVITILNVAGRGEPLTFKQCVQISGNRLLRVPKPFFRAFLGLLWKLGISGIPPDAVPYMTGTYVLDTTRLREFLGSDYEEVIHHSVERAFADSFKPTVEHAVGAAEPSAAH